MTTEAGKVRRFIHSSYGMAMVVKGAAFVDLDDKSITQSVFVLNADYEAGERRIAELERQVAELSADAGRLRGQLLVAKQMLETVAHCENNECQLCHTNTKYTAQCIDAAMAQEKEHD